MTDSFLLIGQSNMAGRGFLTDENRISHDRITKLVNGKWWRMFEPVNPDRIGSGASLAPSFALEYLKYTDKTIGLIPAADGGTCIAEWQKGQPLYDNAVFQAKMAMRQSTLKAILWHQGESDTTDEQIAVYKEKLLKMIDCLKADLELPDIKIYVGGLGEYLENYAVGSDLSRNWSKINKILMEVAKERNDIEFVPADGLTSNPDNLHFDTESLREFGIRYFNAYAKDHPELVKAAEKSEAAEVYTEERLNEMKLLLENGKIGKDEYNAYFKKYIEML